MSCIEDYIKNIRHLALYMESGQKRKNVGYAIKYESFDIDLESLKSDLEGKLSEKRKKITEDETHKAEI
jgi:hypothetical protein